MFLLDTNSSIAIAKHDLICLLEEIERINRVEALKLHKSSDNLREAALNE